MDTCRHIVSTRRLGLTETQAEYPLRLAQHQLMPKDLAEKIAELVKLRSILAHRYLEIDYTKLHAKAQETAEQTIPKFAEWIKKFLSFEACRKNNRKRKIHIRKLRANTKHPGYEVINIDKMGILNMLA